MIYILLTWLLAPIWWPIAQLRQWLQPKPQRILIAEIAGIGDVVCSTAVFTAVRQRYPYAHIALMVDTIAADLAKDIRNVDQVIVFRAAAQRGLGGRLALMRQLAGFDTFVCLIPSAAQLTAACWSAIPRRYSVLPDLPVHSYTLLAPLMTQTAAHQTGANFVSTQLRMLAPLGIVGKPEDRHLEITDIARQAADRLLSQSNPCTWIGIAIGSGQGIKALHPAMLERLIGDLVEDSRLGVVLIGGTKEASLAEKLCSQTLGSQRCVNAVAQITLDNLPGLLDRLSVFIGVDSGVTYMADALGIPLVYIPGPASPADQGPIRAKRIDLAIPLACAPCSRVFITPGKCRIGLNLCTRYFTERDIVEAVRRLLAGDAQ